MSGNEGTSRGRCHQTIRVSVARRGRRDLCMKYGCEYCVACSVAMVRQHMKRMLMSSLYAELFLDPKESSAGTSLLLIS